MSKIRTLAIPVAAGLAMIGGVALSYAGLASAQTATSSMSIAGGNVTTTRMPHMGKGRSGGHAPLGQDGNVTAINGSTITMQEEADEGGTSYTVDASSATITKDGAASSLSAIAVGDKIFVKGTVSGTNVAATTISDGHPEGRHGWK